MGLGMRMRALVTVVGLLLMALAVEAVAATQVRSVRLWRAPDNTRLVFDLSGPVQHSLFTLTSPDRLVIDRIWSAVMIWLDERRYYIDARRLIRGSVNG